MPERISFGLIREFIREPRGFDDEFIGNMVTQVVDGIMPRRLNAFVTPPSDDGLELLRRSVEDEIIGRLRSYGVAIARCVWSGDLGLHSRGRSLGNDWVCRESFVEHGCFCEACDVAMHSDDSYSVRDSNLCESCYHDRYWFCDVCDTEHDAGELCPEDEGEDEGEEEPSAFAQPIRHSRINGQPEATPETSLLYRQRSSGLLLVHSTNVLTVHQGFRSAPGEALPENPLWLGVELEVEPNQNNVVSDYIKRAHKEVGSFAILKKDGTLSHAGFEIVSVPGTLRWHRGVWGPFFKEAAPFLSSWTDGHCGMHVHIDRAALSAMTVGKLYRFLNDRANSGLLYKIAGRGNGEYHTYSPSHMRISEGFKIEASSHYDVLSRSATNSIYDMSTTLELRMFRGNVAKAGFFKNLEFTAAICEFVQEVSINNLTSSGFINWFGIPGNHGRFEMLTKWMRTHGFLTLTGPLKDVPQFADSVAAD